MFGLVKYTDDAIDAVNRWDGIMSAPSKENRKLVNGVAVLENPMLEKWVATSHWATPALWFFPVIGYTVYKSVTDPVVSAAAMAGLMFTGIFGWTLLEYVLHRWVFHKVPGPTFASKMRIFMTHGYHHEFPSHKQRLVAPPSLSFPIAAVVFPTYYFGLGPHYYAPLLAGTLIGYLLYDWIHYYTHHARPTTRAGKFLRRYHMEHHFKDQSTHFGLSSPFWDLVFRTYTRPTAPQADEIEILGNAGEGNFDEEPTVGTPAQHPTV